MSGSEPKLISLIHRVLSPSQRGEGRSGRKPGALIPPACFLHSNVWLGYVSQRGILFGKFTPPFFFQYQRLTFLTRHH